MRAPIGRVGTFAEKVGRIGLGTVSDVRMLRRAFLVLTLLSAGCAGGPDPMTNDQPAPCRLHYLEIVTPEVESTCEALAAVHGTTFGEPVPEFGNGRTAPLAGGGLVSVRGPMRSDESPVVRPYATVTDLEAAVASAEAGGGLIALPPMEIPGRGRIAIYILGGIEHGLWEPAPAEAN